MKKLVAVSLVLGLVGWVAACSQGDTHPPMLGDCASCGSPIINVGIGGDSGSGDSTTDAAKDVTSSDVAQDSTSDVSQDAPSDTSTDTGPLDTGTGG